LAEPLAGGAAALSGFPAAVLGRGARPRLLASQELGDPVFQVWAIPFIRPIYDFTQQQRSSARSPAVLPSQKSLLLQVVREEASCPVCPVVHVKQLCR